MPRGYSHGASRERQAVKLLQDDDWAAGRNAGSHGEADVWAMKAGYQPRLIQVKTDANYAFANFGPKDRLALLKLADLAGARAELWWWPPRKPLKVIPVSEWPKLRVS